jgi:hypothetical protein
MSNMDDYYIKMTQIPKVTQQGVALNTFELANTEAEQIDALPVFTAQKSIVAADESLNNSQLEALSQISDSELKEQIIIANAKDRVVQLSEKQRLIGFGFLAYLAFKFLK